MALKHYKPTTPGQRQLVLVDRSALYKGAPVKALTTGKISSGGRNNNGRITVRFRGGEGRSSGGRHPVTPWGKPTKGKKTRTNKKTTKFIISSRHARKKK